MRVLFFLCCSIFSLYQYGCLRSASAFIVAKKKGVNGVHLALSYCVLY